jgi:hypothetical protein
MQATELKPQVGTTLLTWKGTPYQMSDGQQYHITFVSGDVTTVDFLDGYHFVTAPLTKKDGTPSTTRTKSFWVTGDYSSVRPVDPWKAYDRR